MSLNDLPDSFWIRQATEGEIPFDLQSVSASVRESVAESVNSDPMLHDVFVPTEDGKFKPNRASAILSGHFEGMPIVPGVISKRLASKFLGVDLYDSAKLSWGRKLSWKTTFPGALGVMSEPAGFALSTGKYSLESNGKQVAEFEYAEHPEPGEGIRANLGAMNVRDLYYQLVNDTEKDDPENYVLQSDPFRFVTTAWALWRWAESANPTLLWGYFDVPEDFIFIDEAGHVHMEIIEESVAQISSMAFAKSRGLPPIRSGHEPNPKAQVLTFKSSMAERGDGRLSPSGRLTVAIDVFESDGRTVKFGYEAWNAARMRVISWVIEGTAVPMRILKRMLG